MLYRNYKVTRNLVWEIILREGISNLPVKTSALCKQMGIDVRMCAELSKSGEARMMQGEPVIFVSTHDQIERQRFTVAHELGHIMLGHVGKYHLVNREPSTMDNPIEQEANIFASRLLAPACVLWGCNVQSADDIMLLCKISRTAAEYRMERMRVLYARNKFLTSPLERCVYEQFIAYIDTHRMHHT